MLGRIDWEDEARKLDAPEASGGYETPEVLKKRARHEKRANRVTGTMAALLIAGCAADVDKATSDKSNKVDNVTAALTAGEFAETNNTGISFATTYPWMDKDKLIDFVNINGTRYVIMFDQSDASLKSAIVGQTAEEISMNEPTLQPEDFSDITAEGGYLPGKLAFLPGSKVRAATILGGLREYDLVVNPDGTLDLNNPEEVVLEGPDGGSIEYLPGVLVNGTTAPKNLFVTGVTATLGNPVHAYDAETGEKVDINENIFAQCSVPSAESTGEVVQARPNPDTGKCEIFFAGTVNDLAGFETPNKTVKATVEFDDSVTIGGMPISLWIPANFSKFAVNIVSMPQGDGPDQLYFTANVSGFGLITFIGRLVESNGPISDFTPPPDVPGGLVEATVSLDETDGLSDIQITWTIAENPDGDTVEQKIYIQEVGGDWSAPAVETVSPGVTSATIPNMAPGTYEVKVTQTDGLNESFGIQSEVIEIAPIAAPPDVTLGGSSVEYDETTEKFDITINWTNPEESDADFIRVYIDSGDGEWVLDKTINDPSTTFYTSDELVEGAYRFKVSTVKVVAGEEYESAGVITPEIETGDKTAPDKITGLTAEAGINGDKYFFNLEWAPVNGAATIYVERSSNGQDFTLIASLPGDTTYYKAEGLDEGTYWFKLRPEDNATPPNSAAAILIQKETGDLIPPGKVTTASFESKIDIPSHTYKVSIDWPDAKDAVSYQVWVKGPNDAEFKLAGESSNSEFDLSGVSEGLHQAQLVSVDKAGNINTSEAFELNLAEIPFPPHAVGDACLSLLETGKVQVMPVDENIAADACELTCYDGIASEPDQVDKDGQLMFFASVLADGGQCKYKLTINDIPVNLTVTDGEIIMEMENADHPNQVFGYPVSGTSDIDKNSENFSPFEMIKKHPNGIHVISAVGTDHGITVNQDGSVDGQLRHGLLHHKVLDPADKSIILSQLFYEVAVGEDPYSYPVENVENLTPPDEDPFADAGGGDVGGPDAGGSDAGSGDVDASGGQDSGPTPDIDAGGGDADTNGADEGGNGGSDGGCNAAPGEGGGNPAVPMGTALLALLAMSAVRVREFVAARIPSAVRSRISREVDSVKRSA